MHAGINRVGAWEWEIPIGFIPGMRVPGRFYLSEELAGTLEEGALVQLANVATMPGIVKHSLAMPDIHWGYGFPIGGVAAFDLQEGVVSPGGVGFDINCGVRLVASPLTETDIARNRRQLVEELFRAVPTGVGARSALSLSNRELTDLMLTGAAWGVKQGFGMESDLVHSEEKGGMKRADPDAVSGKARQRGMPQVGTLGAGNHFLEVHVVREILEPRAAAAYGVSPG
ncbi:MAG: RtcB family protein, partial [Methanomicrobiaceae archaeon]|nr:RtcB family protein [Methanomicrobiaceae archaeon]